MGSLTQVLERNGGCSDTVGRSRRASETASDDGAPEALRLARQRYEESSSEGVGRSAAPPGFTSEHECGGTLSSAPATSSSGWPSEPPAFPLFPLRRGQVLNGSWQFGFVRGGWNLAAIRPSRLPIELTMNISVPSSFDALPELSGQRGTGFYRTQVDVTPYTAALLHVGPESTPPGGARHAATCNLPHVPHPSRRR